jgi:hypothetical protein
MTCHLGLYSIDRDMVEHWDSALKASGIDYEWDLYRQRYLIPMQYCVACRCYYAQSLEEVLVATRLMEMFTGKKVFWDCDEEKMVIG